MTGERPAGYSCATTSVLILAPALSDVCRLACGRNPQVEHFGEDEEGKTHGYLVNRIEGFFNRRNRIAHALNSGASSSPEDIGQDIDIFRALGQSLCEILESKQN